MALNAWYRCHLGIRGRVRRAPLCDATADHAWPRGASSFAAHRREFACGGRSTLWAATTARASVTGADASAFADLGVGGGLVSALEEMGVETPTDVQRLAIDAILSGASTTPSPLPAGARGGRPARPPSSYLVASHTGSGKTLAYLLPIVQALKAQEAASGARARPKRPRAIVLAPTQELSEQIFRVCKRLSHHAKFSAAVASNSGTFSKQKLRMRTPLDVIVGTPSRILRLNREGLLWYGDVRYLVLDEADLMLERDFEASVLEVLAPIATKADAEHCAVVLATASKTRGVERLMRNHLGGDEAMRAESGAPSASGVRFVAPAAGGAGGHHAAAPRMQELVTDSLHRPVATAKHHFVPVGTMDKMDALMGTLAPLGGPRDAAPRRVVIFCNTLNSCRAVDHALNNQGLSVSSVHGSIPNQQRKKGLADFLSDDLSPAPQPLHGEAPPVPALGKALRVLVTTDVASRGLDFGAGVSAVLNFDFPHTHRDYLHRAGRTARAGRRGHVYSLVRGREKRLAHEIERLVAGDARIEEQARTKAGGAGGGERGGEAGRRRQPKLQKPRRWYPPR